MTAYVVRRLIMLIPVLIGVSVLTFLMVHLAPGDPVDALLPDYASQEAMDRLREQLGLDKPLHEQYFIYVRNAVQLDFGRSLRTNRPVGAEIMARWPITLELTLFAMVISIGLGIPLGVISGIKHNSTLDYGTMVLAMMWVCMPSFFLALLLQLFFAMHLGWFPVFGRAGSIFTAAGLLSAVMPAFALGSRSSAILARMSRSSMLEVLREDYIRTARAKGNPEAVVLVKHALKNALIPAVTLVGLQFGGLLGGAFIIETVFARPGLGRYAVTSVFQRDIPVVQGTAMVIAFVYVMVNLLVDVLYAYLDPRIKYD